MTSRELWVTRTRESVARTMARDGIPWTASYLEDALDITTWYAGTGIVDQRTARECSAACRWLVEQGYAVRFDEADRIPGDPPGVLYELTEAGRSYAAQVTASPTGRRL